MKKRNFITLFGLGLLFLGGIGFGLAQTSNYKPNYNVVYAEPDEDPAEDPAPVAAECSVIIAETKHGTVSVDKTEGNVGDIVTITANHDIFYTISSVTMNGTTLIESEETRGVYTFALVSGENKIEVKFVIDEELLGEMSIIMDQAINKDWTNLFSVENVLRIVTFVCNGGILIAVARYFIKDKRLEKKLENKVSEIMNSLVPETTKQIVLATVKDFVTPIFSELKLDNEEIKNALTVFSRCFALAQENTPEAKLAITEELCSLKLGDKETISRVKDSIEKFMQEQSQQMIALMERMNSIEASNKKIVEEAKIEKGSEPVVEAAIVEEPEAPKDDGTQI